MGDCRNCGAPLPSNAPRHRVYCLPVKGRTPCRQLWHRRKKSQERRAKQKIPKIEEHRVKEHLPNPRDARKKVDPVAFPDDLLSLTQAEIVCLPLNPSIIKTLLDAKIKLDDKDRQIRTMREAQDIKEEIHLDPKDAKIAARAIAKRRYTPRTSQS